MQGAGEQNDFECRCGAPLGKVKEERLQETRPVGGRGAWSVPIRRLIDRYDGAGHCDQICPLPPCAAFWSGRDCAARAARCSEREPRGLPLLRGSAAASLSTARITSSIRTSSLRSSAINRDTFIGASVFNCG